MSNVVSELERDRGSDGKSGVLLFECLDSGSPPKIYKKYSLILAYPRFSTLNLVSSLTLSHSYILTETPTSSKTLVHPRSL